MLLPPHPYAASLTADLPLYRRTSSLVLAVGHAAAAAPPELLLPRADSLAQGALLPPAAAATTTHLQTSVAQAFALLAAAVHGPGTLAARDTMLDHLLGYLKPPPSSVDADRRAAAVRRRRAVIDAAARLAALPPAPPADLSEKLVTALGEQLEAEAAAEVAESDVEAEDLPDEGLDDTAAELGVGAAALLISLLGHDGGNASHLHDGPAALPALLAPSLDLARSPATPRRLLALDVTARLLARACEGPPSNNGPPSARAERAARTAAAASAAAPAPATISAAWSAFVTPPGQAAASAVSDGASPPDALGSLVGSLLPRTADPHPQVRRHAAGSLLALLHLRPRSTAASETEQAAHTEAVASLQLCCAASELQPRLEAQRRLSPALCALLPPPALRAAARVLVGGLADEWRGAAVRSPASNPLCTMRRLPLSTHPFTALFHRRPASL